MNEGRRGKKEWKKGNATAVVDVDMDRQKDRSEQRNGETVKDEITMIAKTRAKNDAVD